MMEVPGDGWTMELYYELYYYCMCIIGWKDRASIAGSSKVRKGLKGKSRGIIILLHIPTQGNRHGRSLEVICSIYLALDLMNSNVNRC